MPPKRRGGVSGNRGTRSGTRSQSTVQAPTDSRSPSVAVTGGRVAANHLGPREGEGIKGYGASRGGRGRGRQVVSQDGVLEMYQDMLRDVVGAPAKRPEEFSDSEESRSPKRRKAVVSRTGEAGSSSDGYKGKGVLVEHTEGPDQHIDNEDGPENEVESTRSEDESEEEDWEDVDLSKQPIISFAGPSEPGPPKPQTLELVLDARSKRKTGPPRRTITAVDRRIRLEIHKMHVLCLLVHVYQRSRWCNLAIAKENLRPLMEKNIHSLLNPDPDDQQFRRSYNFLEGLKRASEMWRKKFRITRKGISKPRWHDPETLKIVLSQPPTDGDHPMKKDNFLAASTNLTGSRDLGAQLFCALLRSVGVTCRLVCSLQPLSFSFQDKSAPSRPMPTIPITALQDGDNTSSEENEMQVNNRFGGPGPATPTLSTLSTRGRGGGLRRPRFREPIIKPPPSMKKAPPIIVRESPYPIYWVEAWNMATQKWIAVDPLSTLTVGKPNKIEPPISDVENVMSYVVAFEEEGQAQDVTRRYVKSYNGKTRRLRVSCTKGGAEWWDRVLKVFQRGWDLDRDQLEIAELLEREVSEPIPSNIQDLKDHPLFALKRHLKRGEVIHPGKKVASITTGTGKNKITETIFRRQDVKVVKSSEQWYRLGRELKPGEQPLKYAMARRRLRGSNQDAESGVEEDGGEEGGRQTAMYAEFQTVLYEPPAVLYGRVPKNSFGNLDVFVPSMVPKGGVHLPYKGITKAAKFLGIDYAEAVTGFEFKNRQASAIMEGIVVAKEYREAVETVMEGFLDEKNEAEEFKRSLEALKRWRRFLMALRIRERLGIYPDDKQTEITEKDETFGNVGEVSKVGEDTAGGFFAETVENSDDGGGGFLVSDDGNEGGGGGFIAVGDGDEGGGFFTEEGQSESEDEEVLEDPEDEDLGWF